MKKPLSPFGSLVLAKMRLTMTLRAIEDGRAPADAFWPFLHEVELAESSYLQSRER